MSLTCPGRYTDEASGRGISCQWTHDPEGLHHAHDAGRCIMWTDGAAAINSAAACPQPPAYQAEQPAPGPCPVDGCGWDAEDTLDDHLYEHDYNELRPTVARLALENDQLRTKLAKSRRDALFAASEIADSVQAETSADKALRATIVAKLRVAAMADDKCAKCQHRRGDHHYGGICKVRRSATTHCACGEYGFPPAAPKEA